MLLISTKVGAVVSGCSIYTHSAYTDFNASTNSGVATTLWLNIHTKLSSTTLANNGDYILFSSGKITLSHISSNPSITNYAIPNGIIIADRTVSSPVTTYDSSKSTWTTKVPVGYSSSDIFICGAVIQSSNGFTVSSGKQDVLAGYWSSNKGSNVASSWFYGLACYQPRFYYSSISGSNVVYPVATSGEQAGTPTTQLSHLVAGGSGGGGSNYTGSYSSTDNYTCCTAGIAPLPVELLYFKAAKTTQNTVAFSWATATEINNNFFTIERSSDNKIFVPVKTVKGAGNSNTILQYSETDENPATINYYRLKQTDYNGDFTYSKTIAVMMDEPEANPLINIYPNPTHDAGSVTLDLSGISGMTDIIVANIQGQNIAYSTMSLDGNDTKVRLDGLLSNKLKPGIYNIIISNGKNVFSRKLMVQ